MCKGYNAGNYVQLLDWLIVKGIMQPSVFFKCCTFELGTVFFRLFFQAHLSRRLWGRAVCPSIQKFK